MSHTITVRLSKELATWLEEVAARTGVSQGKIVRDQRFQRARLKAEALVSRSCVWASSRVTGAPAAQAHGAAGGRSSDTRSSGPEGCRDLEGVRALIPVSART